MAHERIKIDRDKLRAAIRKLGPEYAFYILDEAIDLLPTTKLAKIVGQYLRLETLRPDNARQKHPDLLTAVKDFEKASLAGEYFESFNVNSRNCTEKSTGTAAWISRCRRLLDRCVAEADAGDAPTVRQAFDIILGLLDRIDECREDIIFFADEAGAWQVGVHWEKVLPPWFKVLSATAEPEEYALRITSLLKHHYHYGSAKMLTAARKVGTAAQRQALPPPEDDVRRARK